MVDSQLFDRENLLIARSEGLATFVRRRCRNPSPSCADSHFAFTHGESRISPAIEGEPFTGEAEFIQRVLTSGLLWSAACGTFYIAISRNPLSTPPFVRLSRPTSSCLFVALPHGRSYKYLLLINREKCLSPTTRDRSLTVTSRARASIFPSS